MNSTNMEPEIQYALSKQMSKCLILRAWLINNYCLNA